MQHDKRKKKFDTQKLKANILVLERRFLTYGNLLLNPVNFDFLAGLLIEEFNMLFDIVSSHTHIIIYPDCKGTVKRFYDKAIDFVIQMLQLILKLYLVGFMSKDLLGESEIRLF